MNLSIILLLSKRESKQHQLKAVVTGVIQSESGEALPGVSVVVKGTTTGAISDVDGKYSVRVPEGYNTLIFSSLSYTTQEVEINGQTEINITLKEDISELQEVLVVGYGTTLKKDLTGSVGSIESEDILQIKTQTVDQALVGKITGVHVSANGGGPGSGAVVHVRGLSQIRGDNQPLYVVDGVPIIINPNFGTNGLGTFGDRENPLLSINPNDVERIDVLKDASAAAIYGSRAANGVILITTKRGRRNQKPQFSFSFNTTIQNPTAKYELFNAQEYRDFTSAHAQRVLNNSPFPEAQWPFRHPEELQIVNDPENFYGDADTDWQDLITNKNALWTQYNFSISGGSNQINYLVSASASDQEGIMLGNDFDRYNLSTNIDASLTPKLTIGTSINYNYSVNKQSALTGLGNAFFRPDQPVMDADGNFTSFPSFLGPILNPLGDGARVDNKAISQNLFGSIYGEYEIIKNLKFKSQLSLNLNNDRSSVFKPSFTESALFSAFFSGVPGASLENQRSDGYFTSFSNTLTYNNTIFDDHSINVVAGLSWDRNRLDLEAQDYAGFPDDFILRNINSAQAITEFRK